MYKKKLNKFLFIVCFFLIFIFIAYNDLSATVYKWVGKDGITHISDFPPPAYKEEKEIPPKGIKKDVQTHGETASSPEADLPAVKKVTEPVSSEKEKSLKPPIKEKPAIKEETVLPTDKENLKERIEPITKPPLKKFQQIPLVSEKPQINPFTSNYIKWTFITVTILSVFLIIFSLYSLYLIAKKLNIPSPWLAWIPVFNIYTMVKAGEKPWWWILILLLIPIANIVLFIILWMSICENLRINNRLGLLMLIPNILTPVVFITSSILLPLLISLSSNNLISFIIITIILLLGLLPMVIIFTLPYYYYKKSEKVPVKLGQSKPEEKRLFRRAKTFEESKPDEGESTDKAEKNREMVGPLKDTPEITETPVILDTNKFVEDKIDSQVDKPKEKLSDKLQEADNKSDRLEEINLHFESEDRLAGISLELESEEKDDDTAQKPESTDEKTDIKKKDDESS